MSLISAIKWIVSKESTIICYKMRGKTNDTATIFKTVVEIYKSDFDTELSGQGHGPDEIAELISKGYEDIRASNPEIWSTEQQIDEIIAEVIRKKSFRAFEQLMSPFEGFKGIDLQIDVLLLAAKLGCPRERFLGITSGTVSDRF